MSSMVMPTFCGMMIAMGKVEGFSANGSKSIWSIILHPRLPTGVISGIIQWDKTSQETESNLETKQRGSNMKPENMDDPQPRKNTTIKNILRGDVYILQGKSTLYAN